MKLVNYSVKGYKSLREVCVSKLSGLNIFIGKNNTGKSALIASMREGPRAAGNGIAWDGNLRTLVQPEVKPEQTFDIELTEKEIRRVLTDSLQRMDVPIQTVGPGVHTAAFKHEILKWFRITSSFEGTRSVSILKHNGSFLTPKESTTKLPALFREHLNLDYKHFANNINAITTDFALQGIAPHMYCFDVTRRSRRHVAAAEHSREWPLDTQGGNLVRTLHFLQLNKKSCFGKICEAVNNIIPGIGTPTVIDQVGSYEIYFENAFGTQALALHEMGAGIEQILLLVTAVCSAEFSRTFFIQIDEPENYLHISAQRRLMRFISANTDHIQFFLTTQSPALLDAVSKASLYRVSLADDRFTAVNQIPTKGVRTAAIELGYSPGLIMQSDLVIYVEGPTDIPAIREWLKKYSEFNLLDISYLPLGGRTMHHENIDPCDLAGAHPLSVAIFDSEAVGSDDRIKRIDFEKACKTAELKCHRLQKAAIENYFPERVLREHYGNLVPTPFVAGDDRPLAKQFPTWLDKRDNGILASLMNTAEIEGTDLSDFIQILREFARILAASND